MRLLPMITIIRDRKICKMRTCTYLSIYSLRTLELPVLLLVALGKIKTANLIILKSSITSVDAYFTYFPISTL